MLNCHLGCRPVTTLQWARQLEKDHDQVSIIHRDPVNALNLSLRRVYRGPLFLVKFIG
jgi:hypothetical protein